MRPYTKWNPGDLRPVRAATGTQLGTQIPAWHRVACGVDGLVTDGASWRVRMPPVPYARDLFRRMVLTQQPFDVAPPWAVQSQTRWAWRRSCPLIGTAIA